jgi:hypothetical protein
LEAIYCHRCRCRISVAVPAAVVPLVHQPSMPHHQEAAVLAGPLSVLMPGPAAARQFPRSCGSEPALSAHASRPGCRAAESSPPRQLAEPGISDRTPKRLIKNSIAG